MKVKPRDPARDEQAQKGPQTRFFADCLLLNGATPAIK
jgi:hypothetical protein